MQFLADVLVTRPDCQGKRYRPEILEVTSAAGHRRGTDMTVTEAYNFFHGFDMKSRPVFSN